MRITTAVDGDAGMLTIEVEGRVELLPLYRVPGYVAGLFALALTDAETDAYEVEESRTTAARLLATGLTDQQVADTIGVDADQVRRWDCDAAIDGYHDQLADVLGVS